MGPVPCARTPGASAPPPLRHVVASSPPHAACGRRTVPQTLRTPRPPTPTPCDTRQEFGYSKVNSIDFSRTDDLVLAAGDDDSIRVYNSATGSSVDMVHSKKYGVQSACFTHAPDCIIYASRPKVRGRAGARAGLRMAGTIHTPYRYGRMVPRPPCGWHGWLPPVGRPELATRATACSSSSSSSSSSRAGIPSTTRCPPTATAHSHDSHTQQWAMLGALWAGEGGRCGRTTRCLHMQMCAWRDTQPMSTCCC